MKSLRHKQTHYFRDGFIRFPSINKAKADSYGINGTSVISDKPTAYSVFGLDEQHIHKSDITPYPPEFQAQLDQLQEIADRVQS
jgi:hypothetical protein